MGKTGMGGSMSRGTAAQYATQVGNEFGGLAGARRTLGGPLVRLSDGRSVVLPDFTKQVRAGAKLMDGELPGWWRYIDTTALDLKNENMCVLGQTWSHYADGQDLAKTQYESSNFRKFFRSMFGKQFSEGAEGRDTSAKYGFNIPRVEARLVNYQLDWEDVREAWARMWEHLTTTWLDEIRGRQEHVVNLDEDQAKERYNNAILAGKSHGQALLEVASAAVVPV